MADRPRLANRRWNSAAMPYEVIADLCAGLLGVGLLQKAAAAIELGPALLDTGVQLPVTLAAWVRMAYGLASPCEPVSLTQHCDRYGMLPLTESLLTRVLLRPTGAHSSSSGGFIGVPVC